VAALSEWTDRRRPSSSRADSQRSAAASASGTSRVLARSLTTSLLMLATCCGVSVRHESGGSVGDDMAPLNACDVDADCVIAKRAGTCCACPQVVSRTTRDSDPCFDGDTTAIPSSCPVDSTCGTSCQACEISFVPRCIDGRCRAEECPEHLACDGVCTDPTTDFNCGHCHFFCNDGAHCHRGVCG